MAAGPAAHPRRFQRELALLREGSGEPGTRRWRWLKLLLSLVLAAVFLYFLVAGLREVDWQETGRALRRFDRAAVLTGMGLALAGYLVASTYELLGRRYERHALAPATTFAIGFVAYAFAMSLGALLGGWVVRFRLYSRRGLPAERITRIIGLGVLTNWSGYLLLGGLVFLLQPPAPPPDWALEQDLLRILGLVLLTLCGWYLYLCSRCEGRVWQLRGVSLRCPPLGFAAWQILASGCSWLLMAAVIANYLPDSVGFTTVVATLFLSSVAGLIVRMPAGLGVVEAVFVAVLAHRVGAPTVLAAMLAFRASYYLVPFAGALVVYLLLEAASRGAGVDPRQGQAARRLRPPRAGAVDAAETSEPPRPLLAGGR